MSVPNIHSFSYILHTPPKLETPNLASTCTQDYSTMYKYKKAYHTENGRLFTFQQDSHPRWHSQQEPLAAKWIQEDGTLNLYPTIISQIVEL